MKTNLTITLLATLGAVAFGQEPTPTQPARTPQAPGAPAAPPPPPPSPDRRHDREHPGEHGQRDLRRGDLHGTPPAPLERRRDGPRDPHSVQPPTPAKPTPFLGVMTSPVPPPLGAQLGLPEGFGLLVDEVVGDSPAATAGLQRHDVLKLFNDQQLVDPNQLAALVRAAGKSTDVTLTVVRAGKEMKISAQIGERMVSERKRLLPNMGEIRRNLHDLEGPIREQLRPMQDRMRKFNDRMREFQERFREWQKNPSVGPAPKPPELEAPDAPFGPKPIDILRETRPGGASEIKVITDGKATTWNTAHARVFVKDENGEIEISSVDGKRTLLAKNKEGKVEFNGPIDTDEQRRAVPEHLRKRLEQIDAKTQTRRDDGDAFAHGSLPGPSPQLERDDREIQ